MGLAFSLFWGSEDVDANSMIEVSAGSITKPAGKAMFQMCGVFAEFERSIIRERIGAGLARARANGKRLGRPKVDPEIEEAIRQALAKHDKGMRKIAREMGVGVSVVQRVKGDLLTAERPITG